MFKQPYTVNGPIVADLILSSTRPDTTITATLGDVQTDGSTVSRVTAGSLVGSLRSFLRAPCGQYDVMDCTMYSGTVPVVPWHPYTQDSQRALTTTPTEVLIEVFPTSLVVQPGHRLRIALTTADLPHQGPNLTTLANSAGGVTTVYFGAAHPSRVYLGALQGPATAGGSTAAATSAGRATAASGATVSGTALRRAAGNAGAASPAQASHATAAPSLRTTAAHGLGAPAGYGLLAAGAAGFALRRGRRRHARASGDRPR